METNTICNSLVISVDKPAALEDHIATKALVAIW